MIKKISEIPAFTAGDETLIREVLHPKNEAISLAYSLAHARLEPGKKSLPHILKDSSEVYVIQKGRGLTFINGEAAEVAPGDVAYIPAGAEQYIENIGDDALEFWCIVSPPWKEESEFIR